MIEYLVDDLGLLSSQHVYAFGYFPTIIRTILLIGAIPEDQLVVSGGIKSSVGVTAW